MALFKPEETLSNVLRAVRDIPAINKSNGGKGGDRGKYLQGTAGFGSFGRFFFSSRMHCDISYDLSCLPGHVIESQSNFNVR